MRDWKGRKHTWPRRLPSERRISPRVRVGFTVSMTVSKGRLLPGVVVDVSIGGLRVQVPDFVERDTAVELRLELMVTNRFGEQETHRFEPPMEVVRTLPARRLPDGQPEEYELSLQFTGPDPERERIMGVFMLQTMLFQSEAELT